MFNIIDFTNNICGSNVIEYRYRDSSIKFYSDIEYNKNFYRIKFGENYRFECFSEYIGSHIYNIIGCKAQETLLGVCDFQENKIPVVACKYITGNGDFLCGMDDILDRFCRTEYCTNLEAIISAIKLQNIFDWKVLIKNFWEMFIVDLYISNDDRYSDNWSVIYNVFKEKFELAPVFDCGDCLFSCELKNDFFNILENVGRLQNLDYFLKDTSKGKHEKKGKKLSVIDFLLHTDDRECLKTLVSISKRIDEKKINAMIDEITLLSDWEKNFYKTVLHIRKTFIIDRILHENVLCKSFL